MSAARLQDLLPSDADYAINEEEHDRLWRAQQAASLLAPINHDVATRAGVGHDGVSAIADYIREELLDILSSARHLREPLNPPTGADLI
ncbi:hypothetical protein [Xanthomonas oryzae]|uniref:Uncharacterized protein n=1 Tax=Xanthomonas oryzae pv. oryzae TaxID=64187 RepID=A0AAJ5MB21_XANOO|nr:hypothetical protein [Xanthomonas oryzae]AKN97849.1 hypothetical protein ACU10_14900 [Xanthomonas oryzae pv. oryzicola]OLG57293.1 hypothetical protein BXO407_17380 [Xanthomonas oryzae pv. oryzae]OLG80368.1 hypothetical protein BXO432_11650 [Xanthomonas oryzae pv. oryzae]OLK00854.1 hypothetical protein IXO222_06990 [Xanthomonas oryzae pv. oryzae]QEJ67494.1 hypothetical protein BXO1_002100 [Xanthomonas oryzae pv. oryzae]